MSAEPKAARETVTEDAGRAIALAAKYLGEREEARADVARVEAALVDLWRVTDCGCGHRADLHMHGRTSGCIGGLLLCPCRDSFATIVQRRLRAALDGSAP